MKKFIRTAGFDDSFDGSNAVLAGCVCRGTYPEIFMMAEISVDGMDSTEKIIELINGSSVSSQIRAIYLDGITMAGFNVIDIERLHLESGIPVIVLMKRKPDMSGIEKAVKNVNEWDKRIRIMKKAGDVIYAGNGMYLQLKGVDMESAKELISISSCKGSIPEPLRLAHMLASTAIHGISRRR